MTYTAAQHMQLRCFDFSGSEWFVGHEWSINPCIESYLCEILCSFHYRKHKRRILFSPRLSEKFITIQIGVRKSC